MLNRQAKKWIFTSLAAFLVALVPFCLVFFLRQDFTTRGVSDALFVAGSLTIFVALISFIFNRGTFDMMGYGMYNFINTFRMFGEKKYKTPVEYKEAKQQSRDKRQPLYLPFLILGGVLLVAALVLAIVFSYSV